MNRMLEKLLSLRDDPLYLKVYGMTKEQLSEYLIKHCCNSRKVPKARLCIAHAENLIIEMEKQGEMTERARKIENLLELIHRLVDECHLDSEVFISQSNDRAMRIMSQLGGDDK
jgi:hypothetical protein